MSSNKILLTEDLKEAFNVFDLDQNGTISPSELQSIMQATLGRACPSPEEIALVVQSIDADCSGTIDFNEFLDLMSDQRFRGPEKDELRQTFDMFDKDGNGVISASELGDVMRNLGQKLQEEEIQEMLREADLDGDKNINFDEFKQMLKTQ